MQPIQPSLTRVPESPSVKDACGLIWGCAVQPFESPERDEDQPVTIGPEVKIQRCDACFGYLNHLCQLRARWWVCSLCGHRNHLVGSGTDRLSAEAPELENHCFEYVVPLNSSAAVNSDHAGDGSGGAGRAAGSPLGPGQGRRRGQSSTASDYELPAIQLPPLVLALVDEACDLDAVEAASLALEEFVNSAVPETRFGLLTFSDRLGMYDLGLNNDDDDVGGSGNSDGGGGSSLPHVVHLPLGRVVLPDHDEEARGVLPTFFDYDVDGGDYAVADENGVNNSNGSSGGGGGGSLSSLVECSDLLELDELCAPLNKKGVKAAKAALRALADEAARHQSERSAGAVQCVGLALGRVLKLLLGDKNKTGTESGNPRLPFLGAKILLFLGSPCTHGPGSVVQQAAQGDSGNSGGGGGASVAGPFSAQGLAASSLFASMGARCALSGVSVDVFALASKRPTAGGGGGAYPASDLIGLASLSPLAKLTGGQLRHYALWHRGSGNAAGNAGTPAGEESANTAADTAAVSATLVTTSTVAGRLGLDLGKVASRPCAWRGELRLRTSNDCRVCCGDEAYGSFCADPAFAGGVEGGGLSGGSSPGGGDGGGAGGSAALFHVACCDHSQTLAFGLDFGPCWQDPEEGGSVMRGGSGALYGGERYNQPTKGQTVIQMAFAYSCLVEERTNPAPPPPPSSSSSSSSLPSSSSKSAQDNSDNKAGVRGSKAKDTSQEAVAAPLAAAAAGGEVKRFAVRRLRVYTLALPRTGSVSSVLQGASVDVSLLLLAHKASFEAGRTFCHPNMAWSGSSMPGPYPSALGGGGRSIRLVGATAAAAVPAFLGGSGGVEAEGVETAVVEARTLLRDWLVRLALCCAEHDPRFNGGGSGGASTVADPERLAEEHLETILGPHLALIAPFVFALLRSPLLSSSPSSSSSLSSSSKGRQGVVDWDAFACAEAALGSFTAAESRKGLYGDLLEVRRLSVCTREDRNGVGRKEVSPRDDGGDDGGCWGSILRNCRVSGEPGGGGALRAQQPQRRRNQILLLDSHDVVTLYFPWEPTIAAPCLPSGVSGDGGGGASGDVEGKKDESKGASKVNESSTLILPDSSATSPHPHPPPPLPTSPLGVDLAVDVRAAASLTSMVATALGAAVPVVPPQADEQTPPPPPAELEPPTDNATAVASPPAHDLCFPFPPPCDSDVLRAIRDRANATRSTPHVVVCRQGSADAHAFFESGLVEDQTVVAAAAAVEGEEVCVRNYQAFARALAVELGKEAAEACR